MFARSRHVIAIMIDRSISSLVTNQLSLVRFPFYYQDIDHCHAITTFPFPCRFV